MAPFPSSLSRLLRHQQGDLLLSMRTAVSPAQVDGAVHKERGQRWVPGRPPLRALLCGPEKNLPSGDPALVG